MFRRLFSQLIVLFLLLTLCSGCSLIHAVFGGGSDNQAPTYPSEHVSPAAKPNGNGEGYGVITYYRIKPNYKCTNKDGISVQSYKDSLKIDEASKEFTQTGDKCASAPISSGNSNELEINNDKIVYKGSIFQREIK